MNDVDKTLMALQKDVSNGFSSLRKDVTEELNNIKKDIASINTELAEIKVKVGADYKALHGNGNKGLLDRVAKIENLVSSGGLIYRLVVGVIAWIITTGVAVYAAIK